MEVLNFISDNQVVLTIIAIELLFIWLLKKYRLIGVGICLGIMGVSYALIAWRNLSLNAVLSLINYSVLTIFGVMACLGFVIRLNRFRVNRKR